MEQEYKFIVDVNAAKLARWLRIIGYDALLFTEIDDGLMVKIAYRQNRIILTRDGQLLKRHLITSGKIKAMLIKSEEPKAQLCQVVKQLKLDYNFKPFTLCLECNQRLMRKPKEQIQDRIPPRVYQTQDTYMECPVCHRIYWKGTHWEAMKRELETLTAETTIKSEVT